MSPRAIRAVQLATVAAVVLSIAAGGWLWWRARSYASDPIFRDDGQGGLSRELIPNLRAARVVVPERPHRPEEARSVSGRSTVGRRRSFTLTTERHGFRADADVNDAAAGPRILVVGDSVALGWGVERPDSFPARLADRLGVEVVNAGIPGLQPPDVAERAVRLAALLHPDLVILAKRPRPGTDDVQHLCNGAARLGSTRAAIVFHPVSTFDVGEDGTSPPVPAGCAAPTLDLTAAFRAALPLPGVILERQGGEQVVLRLPERVEQLRVRPKDPRQLADEVVQAFEADTSVNEPLFFDGGHPDAAGFVLYADAVAAFLQERNLVPSRAP